MAFQISPGINVTEIDLTTVVPAVGTTVGAIAGPFTWGPANLPMLIDSENTLVSTFGRPDNYTANTWFTASNFLAYANALQTVRIVKPSSVLSVVNAAGDVSGRNATLKITSVDANGTILTVAITNQGGFYTATPKVLAGGGELGPGQGAVITLVLGSGPTANQVVTATVTSGGTGYVIGHLNATATGDGVLIQNHSDYLANYSSGQKSTEAGMFAAKYAGELGDSISVSIADADSFATWQYAMNFAGGPNTSAVVSTAGGTNDEIHAVVIDSLGLWTGTPDQVLEVWPYMSKCSIATAEDGTSIYYAEVLNRQSKYVWWTGHPTAEQLGITSTLNWGSNDPTTQFDTTAAELTLTSKTGTFVVGETISDSVGVTITPSSSGSGATATATATTGGTPNIVVTVVDQGTLYTSAPTVVISGGSGAAYNWNDVTNSAVATATVLGGKVTGITIADAVGYLTADLLTVTITPAAGAGSGATALVSLDGNGTVIAVNPLVTGSGYTWPPNVTITGPGSFAEVQANLGTGSLASQVVSYTVVNPGEGYSTASGTILGITGSTLAVSIVSGAFAAGESIVGLTSQATATILPVTTELVFGGVAGGPLYLELQGGVDGNPFLTDGEYMTGIDYFKNGADIDVSLIMGADADADLAQYYVSDIAQERMDCVVFLSPPLSAVVDNAGFEATDIIAFRNQLPSSSYAFMDSGWKYQYDRYNDVYRFVPLNGDMAGLCVRTDTTNDPWWSIAGYNRGQIQNVVKLAWNPSKAYRDILYQNSVNPVISDPGQGTLLYGDKTMLSKPSAFDRINVRRLFIVLEKAISTAAKFTLFEFNDQFTQAQFVSMVEPYLSNVQGRRGIYAFRVVCDSTNNTPQVIDSNSFVGDIYIQPERSINFIQLNFVAVNTGVDFNEIIGKF